LTKSKCIRPIFAQVTDLQRK